MPAQCGRKGWGSVTSAHVAAPAATCADASDPPPGYVYTGGAVGEKRCLPPPSLLHRPPRTKKKTKKGVGFGGGGKAAAAAAPPPRADVEEPSAETLARAAVLREQVKKWAMTTLVRGQGLRVCCLRAMTTLVRVSWACVSGLARVLFACDGNTCVCHGHVFQGVLLIPGAASAATAAELRASVVASRRASPRDSYSVVAG